MQEPPKRVSFHLIYGCWVGGVLSTLLGIGCWYALLTGGRPTYSRSMHRDIPLSESLMTATGILALGLILLWVAVKITPRAK